MGFTPANAHIMLCSCSTSIPRESGGGVCQSVLK